MAEYGFKSLYKAYTAPKLTPKDRAKWGEKEEDIEETTEDTTDTDLNNFVNENSPADDVVVVSDPEVIVSDNTWDLNYLDESDRSYILDSQLWAESNYDPDVTSHAGAQGIAQFMPGTWEEAIRRGWVEEGSSPFDADSAVIAQQNYMAHLFDRPIIQKAENDNEKLRRTLASYNWGIGNLTNAIDRAKEEHDDANRWIDYMPTETRNYIKRITDRATEQKGFGATTKYYS